MLQLLQQNARDAVGDLEPPLEPAYQLKDQTVGRKVALIGDLSADRRVLEIVEILMVAVKYRVVPES
jgi:hypothetical protein